MLQSGQSSLAHASSAAGTARATAAKLAEDYPDPLDEEKRAVFLRHVARTVHKYSVIHRTLTLVQRGWKSLQQVIERLEEEQGALQRRLHEMERQTTAGNVATIAASCPLSEKESGMDAKRTRTDANSARTAPVDSTARRRLAVFANMKSVLKSVQKEEVQSYAQLTRTRERIAAQTRLSLVGEDLGRQRQLYAPLNAKLARCTEVEQEARSEVCELLQLMEEMFTMEAQYPACFSLKAAGHAGEVICTRSDKREDSSASATHAERDADKAVAGRAMSVAPDSVQHGTVAYEIPFQPALYTPETEDVLRGQIEEVLDRYLGYRARIDPVLQQLEQERQVRQAQRVDQLMQVIGLGAAEVTAGRAPDTPPALPPPVTRSSAPEALSHATTAPVLAISDSDVETDGGPDGSGQAVGGVADADTHDRALVQSALMALDDFEELY